MLTAPRTHPASALPAGVGVGLKAAHYGAVLDTPQPLAFFEVHAENYMGAGGLAHHVLRTVRERYALSIHGVGLSIGGEGPLDAAHLDRVADLVSRYEPAAFSEHLAWASHGGRFHNDLLPLPYTPDTLARVCTHIDHVQSRLNRRILLENPATYVEFSQSTLSETEFLSSVIARTGCGLLLDVSNVMVSCTNHGRDPWDTLTALPLSAVGEIHLAGYALDHDADGAPLLIDAHDRAVADSVWALYQGVLQRTGPVPTLIEWDNDVPPLPRLVDEAQRAQRCLDAVSREHAA